MPEFRKLSEDEVRDLLTQHSRSMTKKYRLHEADVDSQQPNELTKTTQTSGFIYLDGVQAVAKAKRGKELRERGIEFTSYQLKTLNILIERLQQYILNISKERSGASSPDAQYLQDLQSQVKDVLFDIREVGEASGLNFNNVQVPLISEQRLLAWLERHLLSEDLGNSGFDKLAQDRNWGRLWRALQTLLNTQIVRGGNQKTIFEILRTKVIRTKKDTKKAQKKDDGTRDASLSFKEVRQPNEGRGILPVKEEAKVDLSTVGAIIPSRLERVIKENEIPWYVDSKTGVVIGKCLSKKDNEVDTVITKQELVIFRRFITKMREGKAVHQVIRKSQPTGVFCEKSGNRRYCFISCKNEKGSNGYLLIATGTDKEVFSFLGA